MKNAIIILTCVVLVAVASGCKNRFPESQVFQNIDMRTILLKDSPKTGQPQFDYSINISPEYAIKDYKVVLALSGGERENFLQGVMAECTNKVTQLGGQIMGGGKTSDFSRQELTFDTAKTTGQIVLFGSGVNQTNLQVIAIIFECRR